MFLSVLSLFSGLELVYLCLLCVYILVCLFVFCMFNVCLYVQTSQVERLERELERERRYSSQLMEQVHTLTYVKWWNLYIR